MIKARVMVRGGCRGRRECVAELSPDSCAETRREKVQEEAGKRPRAAAAESISRASLPTVT
jgi:hypothetical protein